MDVVACGDAGAGGPIFLLIQTPIPISAMKVRTDDTD